jgi:hypothetical protein
MSREPVRFGRAHSGKVRGSPKTGSTLLSNRVIAQIRAPAKVSTSSPTAWRTWACEFAEVDTESRLTIGPSWDQPPPWTNRQSHRSQELARPVTPMPLERQGRHGQPNVRGEQLYQAVHVAALKGSREPLY